jgi:uncharacterized protein
MDERLEPRFETATLDPRLSWYCPPSRWHVDPSRGRLVVEADALTDYWQRTHYGFEVDNGHFLRLRASGDFVLTTQVSCFPRHQYDQAGLMLRLSPACWLKTSVEFEPDEAHNRLGAVVTNRQYSDWSTQPSSKQRTSHWFRLRTAGPDCIVRHVARRARLDTNSYGAPRRAPARREHRVWDLLLQPQGRRLPRRVSLLELRARLRRREWPRWIVRCMRQLARRQRVGHGRPWAPQSVARLRDSGGLFLALGK